MDAHRVGSAMIELGGREEEDDSTAMACWSASVALVGDLGQ